MSSSTSIFDAPINDQPSPRTPGNDRNAAGPDPQPDGVPDQELIPVEVLDHPIGQLVFHLATLLSIPCDIIHLAQLLSLAAGKMSLPIHLDIVTGSLGADLLFTSRILQLERFGRIDTTADLRRGEVERFRGFAVLLIRGSQLRLFREATELTTRIFNELHSIPSVWRIGDSPPRIGGVGPVLALMADQTARDFTGFGAAFGTMPDDIKAADLQAFIKKLPSRPSYSCPFQDALSTDMSPENKMIAERMLMIIAILRNVLAEQGKAPVIATSDDYRCTRGFLTKLPVMGADATMSPQAIETATVLFDNVNHESFQHSLPGQSTGGCKWFTRRQAEGWTGRSNNTIKAHLNEMANDGLIEISDEEKPRGRGVLKHYQFIGSPEPPFTRKPPFQELPAPEEIAEVCKSKLQS